MIITVIDKRLFLSNIDARNEFDNIIIKLTNFFTTIMDDDKIKFNGYEGEEGDFQHSCPFLNPFMLWHLPQ